MGEMFRKINEDLHPSPLRAGINKWTEPIPIKIPQNRGDSLNETEIEKSRFVVAGTRSFAVSIKETPRVRDAKRERKEEGESGEN